jgi:hypothetical protein
MEKDLVGYAASLKEKGYTTSEIMYLVSVKSVGITMTKANYKFNQLYDANKIDGFPESSINVLAMFYGEKNLKKMKFKTLYDKVYSLQRCMTSNPDEEEIKEAVEYFKS